MMTTKERITRMYEHRDADRVPITDFPWEGTHLRWIREGMPDNCDWRDFFGVDKTEGLGFDISPRVEYKVLEETDRYYIATSPWGVTMRHFKEMDSTPEFLDFEFCTEEKWQEAKKRMTLDRDRVNWDYYKNCYPYWVEHGHWIFASPHFGFDVTHSGMVGTETLLIAMMEEPEWVSEMFNLFLDNSIAFLDMLWNEGYIFDEISWPDDLGYKNSTFFSEDLYVQLLKPVQKRAVDWAKSKGIRARLHSCGYVMPLIPHFIEIGIECLNPLEVKAGMDILKVKKEYGDKLVINGGMNAQIWDQKELVLAEIEALVPALKENGGYIFSSDHTIPNSVSLENYKAIVAKAKECGSY